MSFTYRARPGTGGAGSCVMQLLCFSVISQTFICTLMNRKSRSIARSEE
jgi:hypothetical protein